MQAPSAYPSSKRTANERHNLSIQTVLLTFLFVSIFKLILALISHIYILYAMSIDDTTLAMYQWPTIKASDVTKFLLIPARRIKHYVELDIVRISEKQPGTGNSRMFTPTNVMEIILMDRLEGIGITPKRLAHISERLSDAVAVFLKSKGDAKYRYLHVTSSLGGEAMVGLPNKSAKSDHWATLVIDLVQLQKDFETLFKKHWLAPNEYGDSARHIDI